MPGLRVLRHPHNRGKGAAIRTALAAASGGYVIIQDADFEYDPADVPRLLAPVLAGEARVVYGARPLDGSGGRWVLDAGNRALTVLTNLLYGTRLHDMETCYKLLPTALLRGFALECSRFDMEPEITAKVTRSGYRIREVPITYRPRAGGKKLSVKRDGLPALGALLRYRTWLPAEPPRRGLTRHQRRHRLQERQDILPAHPHPQRATLGRSGEGPGLEVAGLDQLPQVRRRDPQLGRRLVQGLPPSQEPRQETGAPVRHRLRGGAHRAARLGRRGQPALRPPAWGHPGCPGGGRPAGGSPAAGRPAWGPALTGGAPPGSWPA